jgi:UPF0271 protein
MDLASTPGGNVNGIIDLNCDMGEGMPADALVMPFISSANIACGYHAGDAKTIWQTIELAGKYDVAVGAHVSFADKENFGRKEMDLSAGEIYELVLQQLIIFKEIADSFPVTINHVKPHGALYNMSARDPGIAKAIARSVKDFDHCLILFGLSGSHSVSQARLLGLKTASEVFGDRRYCDDGTLAPRSQSNALIEDSNRVVEQVMQILRRGTANAVSGKEVALVAETICIHGDGAHAPEFAEKVNRALKQNGIRISAPQRDPGTSILQ